MSGIGRQGAASIYDTGYSDDSEKFSFSNPAGWALTWWALSVVVILIMFYLL